jgi:hypothetical protein
LSYFTQRRSQIKKKTERLVYSYFQAAQFTGGSQNIAFSTLTLSNLGGVAAKNVILEISVQFSEIRDYSISGRSGLSGTNKSHSPRLLRIEIQNVLPKEEIAISLLQTYQEKAKISIRSDATIGEE